MSHSVLRVILADQFRLLAFQNIRPNLVEYRWHYVGYIVFVCWLVGIGRYWDHPSAEIWQYAGLGSVAYVFLLSAFLYVVVAPLKPEHWSPLGVFVFVGFTALPGLLYAIPVERFLSLGRAQATNAAFLGVVALWRVVLYIRYLNASAKLPRSLVVVATLLPLSAIVTSLAMLNLEHVVFDIMAGIRPENASPYDKAYTVVFMLTMLSYVAFPLTAIGYVVGIVHARKSVT